MTDLERLAAVLAAADSARQVDLILLTGMSESELAYLAALGEQPDPATEGLECDR